MKITSEPLPERQVLLEIEVEPERHQIAIEKAYKKLAPRVRIPGFRNGKAPRPLIEKQLGRHRLLDEAMEILVPEVYQEALDSENLEAVANPSLEIVSHEPFVFKATVPLKPSVDLGDYKELRIPREPVEVTDEQVEEGMTSLRRRYATIEPVDRAVADGDIIRGDLHANAGDLQMISQDEVEFRASEAALASLPGLFERLVGLSKGDELVAQHEVPEDFEDTDIAGKTVDYRVKIHDVKEEKLAPLDDAFASQVGEGFESVTALRERVHSDLLKQFEDASLHNYHDSAIEKLLEGATIEYPPILLEREIDRVLDEQANLDPRDPRAVQLYLSRLNKTEEEVRDEVKEVADARLLRSLVLTQFAESEGIEVEDADIDAEIATMTASAGEQAEALAQLFNTEAARESIRRSLWSRRVLDRVVAVASGEGDAPAEEKAKPEASAQPAAESSEPPPSRRRRSGPREVE